MYLADYHTHSLCSHDGSATIREMAAQAARAGLTELAVTDHFDLGGTYDPARCREAYDCAVNSSAGVKLLFGVELGEATLDLPRTESVLAAGNYDFVLGSYHNSPIGRDFYDLRDVGEKDCPALLDGYLDDLLAMVDWGGFDVLGHLTYPLRYLNGRDGLNASFAPFGDKLAALFRAMAGKGIGMEVNVSGLNGGWGRMMPELDQLRLFRACGGECVTVGSDAHRAENVGRSVREGQLLLAEAGFRYVAAFDRRRVRYEKIL